MTVSALPDPSEKPNAQVEVNAVEVCAVEADEVEARAKERSGWLSEHWVFDVPLTWHWQRYQLLWAAIAILGGGKLADLLQVGAARVLGLVGLTCATLIGAQVMLSFRYVRLAKLCAGLSLVGLGFAYSGWSQVPSGDSLSEIATRQAQPIVVRATIRAAAVWKPNPHYRPMDRDSQPWRTQWEIQLQEVRDRASWRSTNVRTSLIVDGRIDRFLAGDVIEVYGRFRKIGEPTNPGAFDFARHHQRQAQFVLITADSARQITKVGRQGGYGLSRIRSLAVRHVDRMLRRWVTWEQAPLASALVFGQREQVDWQEQQQLMATGTLHMLAISGLHVEIVAWGTLMICMLFTHSDRARLLCLVTVCLLYAGLADGKPPVLRAVVLISAFELSRCLGRRARLSNLLGLAAIVLFLIQPANIDNVGVHLSFLAVIAIGLFAQRPSADRGADRGEDDAAALKRVIQESLGPWARFVDLARQKVFAMFRLSFWVWLITSPLVWFHFHVIAPIAIPLNVVVAFPLTVSLLMGMVTAVAGVVTPIGWCAGSICGTGLWLIGWLVRVGNDLPLGHFWLPSPPSWWIGMFYGILVGWLLLLGLKRLTALATTLLLWIALGISLFMFGPRGVLGETDVRANDEQGLRATFLDVGHGTSVILELPDGRIWLYDAGHLGAPERSHQEIATAIWELGVSRIDTLILSHADADHYNATRGLAERFCIGRVVSTPQFWNSSDDDVRRLRTRLNGLRVPQIAWSSDSAGQEAGMRWKVLHPRAELELESDNASSLCLLLEYRGKRILLPGDLEGSGMLDLLELPQRPCHALMAPHHGSLTQNPRDILQWCQPEFVVVSGNHRATRPAVVEQYQWPGAILGITFRDGALRFAIDSSGQVSVRRWGDNRWKILAAGK